MASQKELVIKITADASKATKQVDQLTKEIDQFSKATKTAGSNSKNISRGFSNIDSSASKLTATLTSLAAAYLSIEGAKSLVSTAADIEEGFLGISKTTGIAGEAMEKFKTKLYDMSTEMAGISIEGLQKVAETAGQLGIQGQDNIIEFTKVIAKMAATTELSAEESATAMAQLGNSFDIPVKSYENLASAINELSNTTTATAGDLITYSQRIAGMGRTFGLTETQILGFAATLKDIGISAELGGTAVNTMMMEMLKNTEEFAKVSGKSMEEFAEIIKTDPVQAIQLFLNALSKMDKATKVATLDDLKLSASGAAQTMLKLSGSTDLLTKNIKTSSEAWKENISIQKEYETFTEGFNAQMDRAKNAITALASKIGEALLPKLKEMIDEFVKWSDSLDDAKVKKFAKDIADMAAGVADIITVLGEFIAAIGSVAAAQPKMTVAIIATITALKTLNATMLVFGARTVGAAASAPAFTAATGSMTAALTSLWNGLNVIITAAGPWGAAIAAIAGAVIGADAALDNYTESLKKAADADMKSAQDMETHTSAVENIGKLYNQADQEIKDHGSVTKATHDKIEQALKDEIAALEKQTAAMNKSGEMTKLQEKNFISLSETIGALKAKLDTLDADYTIDVELETYKAEKKYDDIKKKVEEPLKTEVGFDPETKAVDQARKNIEKPIKVPVIYVPQNSPSSSGTGGGTKAYSGLVNSILSGIRVPAAASNAGTSSVSGASNPVSTATAPLSTINLNIGSGSFQVMADKAVAEALVRYIETQGGL